MDIATNCLSLDTAAAEMDSVSALSARVKDPLYHFVISWREGEEPDAAEAFESVAHALKNLGFEGHQFVAAIHRDTDNVHVHVMVNRVNPDSFRAVSPSNDYFVMDRCMREMEIRFSRAHDRGPYVVVERNGQKVVEKAKVGAENPRSQKRPAGAERMEVFGGEQSLYTYVRGEPRKAVVALLKDPSLTWISLHQTLATFGIELRQKGRGLGVYAVGADDTTPVKASDLHEDLSLVRLERRLGTFEPPAVHGPEHVTITAPIPEGSSSNAAGHDGADKEGAQRYTPGRESDEVLDRQPRTKRDPAKREARRQARADARNDLKLRYTAYRNAHKRPTLDKDQIKARYSALATRGKERRQAIIQGGGNAIGRKVLHSLLTMELARQRLELQDEIRQERERLKNDPASKRMTYREWVAERAQHGDEAALAQMRGWHYAEGRNQRQQDQAEATQTAPGMTGESPDAPTAIFVFTHLTVHDVLRNGSVVYWHANRRAFIDHGRVVRMASDRDRDEERILAALTFSRQKFGGAFRLTGTDAFIKQAIDIMAKHNIDARLKDHDQARALEAAKARLKPQGPRPG